MATYNSIPSLRWETRLCEVDGRVGYFHTWEQYSKPEIIGVYTSLYGIVEFEDGVKRVEPQNIHFIDEENEMLKILNEQNQIVNHENSAVELLKQDSFDKTVTSINKIIEEE